MSENEEKVLRCGFCDNEVEVCDYCHEELLIRGEIIARPEIICLGEGEHHFCSKKCLNKWLKENVLTAYTEKEG